MKKILSSLIALCSAMSMNAQTVKLYNGETLVKEYKSSEVNKVVFEEETDGHEYVDLGLPSGTLWATMNVGATSIEEVGDFYAWGETETKTIYTMSTYFDTTDNGSTFIKYNKSRSSDVLDLENDVAHVKWGGNWRMPTSTEWTELNENSTWEWTAINGKYGCKFTSKLNGNSIFLPAGGLYSENGLISTDIGFYWSSTYWISEPTYAMRSYFDYPTFFQHINDIVGKCAGHNIRPVRSK